MIKQSCKELVVDTGLEIIQKGITVGTWGNISVRDPETGLIYISPSGIDYEKTRPEHIVVMNQELDILDGRAEPSIEKHMHTEIYIHRKDINAVVHTHPIYSTIFGVTNTPLPAVSEDFVQVVGAEVQIALPYALPGTKELALVAVKALGNNNAVLLPGHGALSVAKDMKTAMKVSVVLEKNAQIYLFARMLGGKIKEFKTSEIEAMQNFARNKYGQQNRDL